MLCSKGAPKGRYPMCHKNKANKCISYFDEYSNLSTMYLAMLHSKGAPNGRYPMCCKARQIIVFYTFMFMH